MRIPIPNGFIHLRNITTYLTLVGVLALFMANWAFYTTLVVACLFIASAIIQGQRRPAISLMTTILLTGLLASWIALAQIGGPWKLVHQFTGHEPNIAMSEDGKLVAGVQTTSVFTFYRHCFA